MRALSRFSAVILTSLALAACWVSTEPLITAADADMPKIEGTWKSSGGKVYVLTANAAQRNFIARSWNELTPENVSNEILTFDLIGNNWYIAQSVQPSQRGYEIVYIAKGRLETYRPGCGSVIVQLGVNVNDSGNCEFSNLGTMRAAAKLEIDRFDREKVFASAQYTRQ